MKTITKPSKFFLKSFIFFIIFNAIFIIASINCKKEAVRLTFPDDKKLEPEDKILELKDKILEDEFAEENIDLLEIGESNKVFILFFESKDKFEQRRGIVFSKNTAELTLDYFESSIIKITGDKDCELPSEPWSPEPGVFCYNCEDGSVRCSNDEKIIKSLNFNVLKMLENKTIKKIR